MVPCNRRCRASKLESNAIHWKIRPCVKQDGGPCLVCQEDMNLERQIQELQDKRRNLLTCMNDSHDPFVLTFPPEISSHIFLLSMEHWDDDPYSGYDLFLRRLPMPFRLGTVCRGWRQLARSTPQLWKTLSFTLAKPTKSRSLEHIRNWLQLSGHLPLTICVASYLGGNPASEEIYGPVIDALNQHSGRWQKLVLRISAPYFRHFCGSSPSSNLYDLEVNNRGHLAIDGVLPTSRMNFNHSHSPTNLTINNIRLSANDIGWANLTTLRMEHVTFNECLEAMRQAPLLESCTLSKVDFLLEDVYIPRTIVRHTHLRKLFLDGIPEFFVDFLDSMECPALEEFSYQWTMTNTLADSLVLLLKRSDSRLKKLLLKCGKYDLAVVDFLNAMPSLQHLELFWDPNAAIMEDFLHELSSSAPILAGGTSGFLPQLRSLEFYSNSPEETLVWKYIPDIYAWPHRKLLSMEVNIQEMRIDHDTLTRISQLIDQGVNISIRRYWRDHTKVLLSTLST